MFLPVCWKVFPTAFPPLPSTRAKPTHALVVLSSPTQGNSCALYLMLLVWCFPNMPSCCHHCTHSYSCALSLSNSLFQCEIYFHTSKRHIPLKETKWKQCLVWVLSICCSAGALRWFVLLAAPAPVSLTVQIHCQCIISKAHVAPATLMSQSWAVTCGRTLL